MKNEKNNQNTIFIVSGLPRSGTSLGMQLLHAAGIASYTDGIREADQHNQRGYFESNRVLTLPRDQSWLAEATGKAVKVITALVRFLPEDYRYKLVFMERSIVEVVLSQQRMLDALGKKGAGMEAGKLVELFHKELDVFWKWVNNQPHFETLSLSYNKLMTDPEQGISDLILFTGSQAQPGDLKRVLNPDLYRSKTNE